MNTMRIIFSFICLFLTISCEPNFCLSLEDHRCLRFEKVQLLDTPPDMESYYNCVLAKTPPTIFFVKQGYFVRERKAILHGLYKEHVPIPDIVSYPSCFYEELGVHAIVIVQGISIFNIFHPLGRSSSKMGIIECSALDVKMTFHHEMFHVMVKRGIFHMKPDEDEEQFAEKYAKIASEYLKSDQHVIPLQHLLNNLR